MRTVLFAGMIITMSRLTFAQTPVPKVEGPIAVTAESYPFGAADHTLAKENLSAVGYVEEEFFVSGTANIYHAPDGGEVAVRTPSAPYTTRMLVRRPKDKAKFSGNVIVEMLNPSNLFDLNIAWAISHKQFVRNGDAWVGVTAKPVSVVSLKNFNPLRYGPLSWANPLKKDDPANCTPQGRDSSQETENGLVWDIHSQISAWLRSREKSNPFLYGQSSSNHPAQHLYGWGYSQTGSFLYTYINMIHPLAAKADGRPPYDGYIVAMSSGPTPLNQCATPLPQGDPRRQFKNAGVPVIRIMSQSDYLRTRQAVRPDSDAPGDLFRNYEIAGSAHATPDELLYCAEPEDIIKAGRDVPPMSCNEGPRSRFPNSLAFNAAIQNLDAWVRKGTPAPRAEPILVENGEPVLDQFGNVRGGIRSPFVDVPTSTWFGNSTGPSFCRIAGHEVPFEKDRLTMLYPTHEDYVNKVRKNVNDLVNQRWMTRADGDDLIAEAERAIVP